MGHGGIDGAPDIHSDRIDFLDVVDQLVVFLDLFLVLQDQRLEDINIAEHKPRNHLSLVFHHTGISDAVAEDGRACQFLHVLYLYLLGFCLHIAGQEKQKKDYYFNSQFFHVAKLANYKRTGYISIVKPLEQNVKIEK